MNNEANLKQEIIKVGKLLYDSKLLTALSGNISARFDKDTLLITAHGTCLGFLKEVDLIKIDLEGRQCSSSVEPSFEMLIHSSIYRETPTHAIVHAHPPLTNGYFNVNDKLLHVSYESLLFLGNVGVVVQNTPNILDVKPVIEALKLNNIVVLKNHGVIAVGDTPMSAYFLIESLEETIKMLLTAKIFGNPNPIKTDDYNKDVTSSEAYAMFSPQHIEEIIKLVNNDDIMKERGKSTSMTMKLAVKMDETGQVYNFHFKDGVIVKTENNEDADFVISAKKDIWQAVFENRVDPFVATTQKKMILKGDFGRISKWYSPCSRIFELWKQVRVK